MPYSYRSGYNRYSRRWPYRSWRRSSLTRSQTAGTRRFSVSIPVVSAFTMSVNAGEYWTNLILIHPYSNDPQNPYYGSLVSSLLYRTYCRLYDQVKIDSCYVKFTILSLIGNGGVSSAVKVCTMWDRHLNQEDLAPGALPTPSNLTTGSESQTTFIVNNAKSIVTRYNGASDIQERTSFHDCSVTNAGGGEFIDSEYQSEHDTGYTPALFVALNTAGAPGGGQTWTFNCSVEVRWRVTFRNPKFGLASGSSAKAGERFSEMQASVVKDLVEEADDEIVEEKAPTKESDESVKPVLKKKKVVYEEEVLPDDDDTLIDDDDEEESQAPLTQPFKSPVKKAGKKG